jgi:hypothetical protein
VTPAPIGSIVPVVSPVVSSGGALPTGVPPLPPLLPMAPRPGAALPPPPPMNSPSVEVARP